MTDKEKIKAEIERLIKYDEMVADHNSQIMELVSRELDRLYHLLKFINSLPEEQEHIREIQEKLQNKFKP